MPSNQAAWLPAKSAPLHVGPADYPVCGADEVIVRTAAVAINPLDWFKQGAGDMMFRFISYPFVMGSDLAGEVVEAGSQVRRFKPGDRVVGHAVGMDERANSSREGAFQQFVVLREHMASPIPDALSAERACVVPLGLSTAACGLFLPDYLGLERPGSPTASPSNSTSPTGPRQQAVVLVWGASSSVGCNAVQLARAAGYEVFATASPRNHALVRELGASAVFDYRSATVVADLIAAFEGKTAAGALAIGSGSLGRCIDVLARCQGRRFVAQVSADLPPEGLPSSAPDWVTFGMKMGYGSAAAKARSLWKGVPSKFVWGTDLAFNDLGRAIYEDFLPRALAQDNFIPAPEPLVVGTGLDHIQDAMDTNRAGVSAKKVVVKL